MQNKLNPKLAKAITDVLELFEIDNEGEFILRWWDKKTIKRKAATLKKEFEKANVK